MPAITLPWPPKQLMPNYKRSHHWSAYRKPIQCARTLAWGLTAQALGPKLREGGKADIEIRLTLTPPMRGGPVADTDNLLGACKHYLDGIADALGVNDRQFMFAPMKWEPKAGDGSVVIAWGE